MTDDVIGRIYFHFDRADLTPASEVVLQSLMEKIQTGDSHILLAGHTDSTGTYAYNFSLGLRRATTVEHYLKAHQTDAGKIQLISYGESRPVASNLSAHGRHLNRRVDISVSENQ